MWNNLKIVSRKYFWRFECFNQPRRTAFILRRTRTPKLSKLGCPKRLDDATYHYKIVENTDCKKKAPLELVLTKDVVGVGMMGEKIEMNIYKAYRDLLLPKLAVYADSPEAKSLMLVKHEKQYSSKYSKIVENYLAYQAVEIILSYDTPWTLQPWHVKFALRKNGILTNEDCITLPKEISGPNLEIENKDFLAYITMNRAEKFPIRCRIYHWSTLETSFKQRTIDLNSPSEALFPDEKELIQSLIKVQQLIIKDRMLRGQIQKKEPKRKNKS